jgi:glycosyltransferase involved in cell wall biosynthesis
MKKTILLVHHSDELGGAGKSLLDIATSLSTHFNVFVVLPRDNSLLYNSFMKIGITIITLGQDLGMISFYSGGPRIFSRTFIVNLLRIFKSYQLIKKIIKKVNPDFLISNSITTSWLSAFNIRTICFIREHIIHKTIFYYLFLGESIKRCKKLIFISEYDKKIINETKKSSIINDSVDKNFIIPKKRTIPKKAIFNVLFLGGTKGYKGFKLIINAARLLESTKIHFFILGQINSSQRIVLNNVTYVDTISNLDNWFRKSDVVVIPNIKPHQSRVIFESGFYSLPVITTYFSATSEFIKNNSNGLTFENNNVFDFKSKIFRLYGDLNLRNKLGSKNYDLSLRNHTYEIFRNSILTLFQNL